MVHRPAVPLLEATPQQVYLNYRIEFTLILYRGYNVILLWGLPDRCASILVCLTAARELSHCLPLLTVTRE
uniref:Uncharacterized protein n=1 Tax=Anguilla anguilla TaxID=7936 RepID=A0A0E9WVV3_ANGAN